jgi:alcohol dehydrogenase, propanol-preferring
VRSDWIASRRISGVHLRVVLRRYTLRGSIVGTRKDLEEALAFATEGKVKATIEQLPLDSINEVFSRLRQGKINGRVVLNVA